MIHYLIARLAVCMLAIFALGTGEQSEFRKILQEDFGGNTITKSPQGAAIYADFLFQFHDYNQGVDIYNLSEGSAVGVMKMTETPTHHCNNVQFSEFFYTKDDKFPLLYVSMENKAEHCILAYRVENPEEGKFSASLIQTITLPTPLEMGVWYPNVVLDIQGGNMYVTGYSRESWNKGTSGNAIQLLRFALPTPIDSDIKLTTSDILDRKLMDFRVATQGACIRNGRLYQVYGVPRYGATSLCCINLEDASLEWYVDLASCGISEEPEALGFWRDELCVVDVKGAVYVSGFKIPVATP